MDGVLQRILHMFNNRLLVNMASDRRSQKLTMVNTLAGNTKTDMEIEISSPLNNLRAVRRRRREGKQKDGERKECEENGGRLPGHGATTRNESDKTETGDLQIYKEEVKRSMSVPVEVETWKKDGLDQGEFCQAPLITPIVSVTNLLEEIEADLPSSYSLANVLDHTLHSVTNLRTWARLSRVGTNCMRIEEAEKVAQSTEADHIHKVKNLQREIFIQKTRVEQADKAVSLCKARNRNLDAEDLESVRVLLMAKLRHEALNVELQKLTFSGGGDVKEESSGQVEISDIWFTLTNSGNCDCDNFVCVAYHKEELFASRVISDKDNEKLHFPVNFNFDHLRHNFIIYLELYKLNCGLKWKKESKKIINLKHLMRVASSKTSGNSSNGERRDFECIGSGSLTLADVRHRQKGKVSIPFNSGCYSTLGNTVSLNVRTRLVLNTKIIGFLDLFKDRCWHRLWCCPVGYALQFWCYPEDKDNGKAPVECILLPHCRENVQPVSMDVCIRPHSFMITYKQSEKGVLLSASSHMDMMNWISYLRMAVRSFEAWDPDF